MSKIYQALRRHDNSATQSMLRGDPPVLARASIVRALESVYPIIYRIAKEAGHGVVLHFVAATPGEGTSTLSNEFALIAARVADSRVLLIDADRNQSTTAANFGCQTDLGLFDQTQAGNPLEPVLVNAPDSSLQVSTLCGQRSPPLSRKAMPAFYDQMRAKYDLTIIDCPAVLTDRYFELSPEAADGIVLVVQAERSRPEIVRHAQSQIENAGGKCVGAILNRRHTYIPDFVYRLL